MGCTTSYIAASSSNELSSFPKTSSQTQTRNLPSPPTRAVDYRQQVIG
ncbi:6141_t:CDS:2 [Funneliformis mosseae]|uniref:6141_t:CDS:1 n=1 Tax=Funneliformis mosseae TaxID=27381 RepID=A0A9N8Z8V9_FUNMO|nr:6141_t:CDS:2 [Funneliformis mosseae]